MLAPMGWVENRVNYLKLFHCGITPRIRLVTYAATRIETRVVTFLMTAKKKDYSQTYTTELL